MQALMHTARLGSLGFEPDGKPYSHVADFIDATGYGGIKKGGFNEAIPAYYWSDTLDFAEYLNYSKNAASLGLKNIGPEIGNNPYNAPEGAIVVIHNVIGTTFAPMDDISVKGPGDAFYNGGLMGYGGSHGFPTYRTRGIFVPIKCSSAPKNMLPFFADHLDVERNEADTLMYLQHYQIGEHELNFFKLPESYLQNASEERAALMNTAN